MDEKNNKNQNQGQNNKDGNKGNKFNQTLLILLIAGVITVLAISCVNTFLNNSTSQEISYTDFISMLENGNVSKVVYDQDVIRITPKTQPIEGLKLTYYTGYIYDEDVIQYMKDNDVEYNVKIQDKSSSILDFLLVYIVPWVLIYFIFSFVFRKMSGGTGASTLTAVHGLAEYMNYNKSMLCLRREWYSDAEWIQMLENEIMTVGPVLYGGATLSNEGHQFILDGYTTEDYFRVNWGWSGYSNGYFLISALNPNNQGAGGSTGGGFVANQDALFGLKPAEGNSSYQTLLAMLAGKSQDGTYYSGLETSETQFNVNSSFIVKCGFLWNLGLDSFSGKVALAMVDKNLNIREFISRISDIPSMQTYYTVSFAPSCRISLTPQPGDRIVAVYKGTNDAEWKVVHGGPDTTNEIIVKADPTSIIETKQEIQFTAFCDKQQETVVVHLPENSHRLNLYDVNGRLLKQILSEGKETITFSCREYPTGVYLLQAVTDKGIHQCKFLK